METSKKVSNFWCGKVMIGGAGGTRTPDLLRAREALSQLSYSPVYQKDYSNWGFHTQLPSVPRRSGLRR